MTMNPLPPQAYTKETLLKAYQWLMSQNSNIKEIATTPDMLVSLYLKSMRDGDSALERPSIKNFKSELKNLAGLMGELDRPQQQQQQQTHAVGATYHQQPPAQQVLPVQPPQQPAYQQPPPVQTVVQTQVMHSAPAANSPVMAAPAMPAQSHPVSYTTDVMELFDCGTKSMIHEVKDEFNLSSELEALRMLIKIGYVKSKGMLK
ncbi:hypothetical protein B9G69_017145 [Bdellovibrio sp. SKB1291214]|uniref:hypothetical protein n=1 Tax=Bdellovibrio sp. SKB1291214 TaxID=1732569 RepID=UPI000B51C64F|nr:hypothetical protein [Bdellovibrio sp. SKB1291214]UYL08771.1 hypothetical protein B9G69_017145 [Bdellovibrio sp. SKB1291214]